MSTARSSRPVPLLRALLALVVATALSACAFAGAAAAAPGSGEVSLSLKPGGENSLLGQGAKAAYKAKAGKTGATKSTVRQPHKAGDAKSVTLPVTDLELLEAATVRTGGMLTLSLNGRQASLKALTLQIAGKTTALSAKLGKKTLVFFRAKGEPGIDSSSVKLSDAQLSLTAKGAKALQGKLGLEKLSSGQVGTVDVDAKLNATTSPTPDKPADKGPGKEKPPALTDPYAQQCALSVTSSTPGSAAGPATEPSLTSPTALTGGAIDWGFSQSFRTYIVTISGGSIVPIAPATAPNQPTDRFSFPTGGEYAFNTASNGADDKAVIDGSGEVVLCNSPHGFRITLSNPTVVIDGVNSRLTVDVDTNMSGVHTPTQRVDLAMLGVNGVTPFYNENTKTVTWSNLPVTLTTAGSEALGLCSGSPGPCSYEAGDPLEALTVTTSSASETAWPFASNYCDIATGTPTTSWPATPPAPLAAPALSSPSSVSSGEIKWGFRNGLRGQVQTLGIFNLTGTTASNPGAMSGPEKFFTWPAATGSYEVGTPGKLVLKGTGSVGICNTTHGYGTVLSDPTVVIDGANSRIVMTVVSRLSPSSWTSGRVDLASLEIGKVEKQVQADTPSSGQETVTWTFPDLGADNAPGGTVENADNADSASSSVKLTAPGTSALWLLNNPYRIAGTPLNKLTVSIVRSSA